MTVSAIKKMNKGHFAMVFLFILFSNLTVFAQDFDHWETIIKTGDTCAYFIPQNDIGSNWITNDFNDSTWTRGKSGIGFGDDDDSTQIEPGATSVYVRYTFEIDTIANISFLIFDIDFDDGFVAYLNGQEIARANINDPLSWNMEISPDHEAKMYSGGRPDRFVIDAEILDNLLVEGKNILAVEVHNTGPGSSDFTSNIFLHAAINSNKLIYHKTVDWFWAPIIHSTFNLPLMVINTNGKTILNDPRIVANMGLINNGQKQGNRISDTPNEYSGQISIEIRGESSQQYDKKSYTIELQKADSSNNNVSILGLPEENDFVLYGPFSDKSFMRNVLTYQLYNELGKWAPRTRYFELILNNDYKGIYVLTEKLKRDKNRVDIAKITEKDSTQEDISGGYIMRRDKTTGMSSDQYWQSPVQQVYFEPLTYQYFDPEAKDLTNPQKQYVKDWMKNFDEVISGNHFDDPQTGARQLIDEQSFIYMLFINELSKGIDNYMFSTYFYKQKDKNGGKLVAGPPWDYNLSYGNLDYGHNDDIPYSYSWVYNHWGRVYWYNRLLEDEYFQNQVYFEWDKASETIFNFEHIEAIIDSCVNVLGDAVDRNFERYPILGMYVWPNAYYPDTFEEEVENLKSWTKLRLEWIDNRWKGKYVEPDTTHSAIYDAFTTNQTGFKVYPNPSDFSQLKIQINFQQSEEKLTFSLFNGSGHLIKSIDLQSVQKGLNQYTLSDLSNFPSGIYLGKISGTMGTIKTLKMIKSNTN